MRKHYLYTPFLLITACSSVPYEPIDIRSISEDSKILIVSSIPPRIEEYEHTMKMNWSGSTESTEYQLDTIPIAGGALSQRLSRKTSAIIEIDYAKSMEYLDENLNSTNPYFLGSLSPQTVENFSQYGEETGYNYVAFVEGEEIGNVIKGGYGNITPFYGIGIYTENESLTYVYASLRVNVLDVASQKNVFTDTCFSFLEVTNEISRIDQKVKLNQSQVAIVESHIPQLIEDCMSGIH